MPIEEYGIKYTSDPSSMVSGNNAVTKSCNEADTAVRKLTKAIAGYNSVVAKLDSAKLTAIAAELKVIGAACGGLASVAVDAAEGLRKVGVGTGNITGATAKINKATTALAATEVQAMDTEAALFKVGVTAQGLGGKMTVATKSAKGLASGFGTMIAQGVALSLVHNSIAALAEGLQHARDFARETATENVKLRDSLRELRGMQTGKDAKSLDDIAGEVLGLMKESGATKEEATEFSTLFDSTISAAHEQKNDKGEATWQLNAKEEDKFKRDMLRLAISKGVKPDVFAEVMGGIGIHQPVKTADEALGQAGMLIDMAGKNAVGRISEVFKAARSTAGWAIRPQGGGAAKSMAEWSGHIAASTTVSRSPLAAARQMDQLWRETSGKGGQEIGITAQDDYMARLEKLKAVLDANKGKDPLQVLKSKGFGNTMANQAIIREVEAIELHRQWSKRAAQGGDPAAIRAEMDKFKKEAPERFTEAENQAGRQKTGAAARPLEDLLNKAEIGLRDRRQVDTERSSANEWWRDKMNIAVWFGEQKQRERRKAAIVQAEILKLPGAKERFPDITGKLGTTGVGRERMESIVNQLTPAERAAVQKGMEEYSRNPTGERVGGGIPAQRPAGVNAPGGAVGPNGGGPQASLDAGDFKDGVREFRAAVAELRGGRGGVPSVRGGGAAGVASINGADFGDQYSPRRAGSMS